MRTGRLISIALLALMLAACADTTPSPPMQTLDHSSLSVEMIVIGDFGSGRGAQYEVAEMIHETTSEADVDFFVTTGDNFYNNDLDRIWTDPYGWLADTDIQIAAAWGNHDRDDETRSKLVQEALDPPGSYYSLDLVEGTLIILDSNNVSDAEQTRWFRDQLEAAESPTIVVFHHPPYTCGVYGNEDIVNDTWLPLIEEFDVPLVLNGHEHHYERFSIGGTAYVVTGGGGQSLRSGKGCPSDTPDPVAANYNDHHFMLVGIGDGVISALSIAADGSMIDSFRIDF